MLAGRVPRFARRWHRRPWALASLPAELGARVVVAPSDRGVVGVAVSYRDVSVIGLSAAIIGTPLELPVLAHEAAHLIARDRFGLCSNRWVEKRVEREAWLGAARLAVSDDQVEAVRSGRLSHQQAACLSGVPVQMLTLALALRDGDASHQLAAWLAEVERLAALL